MGTASHADDQRGRLYCFVFLFLAAAGGGAWSLDRLRDKDSLMESYPLERNKQASRPSV